MELIEWMKEISQCGDSEYEQTIKHHVMMYAAFVREKDNKLLVKSQLIGIDPWCYDYYGNISERIIMKEGAIEGTVKIMTHSEFIEYLEDDILKNGGLM